MSRRPRLNLGINVNLVNESYEKDNGLLLDQPLDSTYRKEGLSIGANYMRYHGQPVSCNSVLSPSSLIVEEIIGRGACSVVKRVKHIETGELFAMKEFFGIRNNSNKSDMLVKEIQGLRNANDCKIGSECLVKLLGGFFVDGTVNVVLEYMDGGSLTDLIRVTRSRSMSEQAIASVAYQVFHGVSSLHERRILHRDIKPANILYNMRGEVKLTDFGISSVGQELNTTVIGTTKYLSPERLCASSYGKRSDIWSIGIVLIELAMGYSPFENLSSFIDLKVAIDEISVEDLIPLNISGHFRELLKFCLQKSPEKRIPAKYLLKSPWFQQCNINEVNDAANIMHIFIQQNL